MIEASREFPGRLDGVIGAIEFAALAHPEVDDVLDDPRAMTREMGGRVVVVPSERMPTNTGKAVTYRYWARARYGESAERAAS